MGILSLVAWFCGNNQFWQISYVGTILWFYSRALIEHETQDPLVKGWKKWVIFFWDAWRSSKFVWAFVPTSFIFVVCFVVSKFV